MDQNLNSQSARAAGDSNRAQEEADEAQRLASEKAAAEAKEHADGLLAQREGELADDFASDDSELDEGEAASPSRFHAADEATEPKSYRERQSEEVDSEMGEEASAGRSRRRNSSSLDPRLDARLDPGSRLRDSGASGFDRSAHEQAQAPAGAETTPALDMARGSGHPSATSAPSIRSDAAASKPVSQTNVQAPVSPQAGRAEAANATLTRMTQRNVGQKQANVERGATVPSAREKAAGANIEQRVEQQRAQRELKPERSQDATKAKSPSM